MIVLTARSAVNDRIAGLRAGADDYVVKPFSPTRGRAARSGGARPWARNLRAIVPETFGGGSLQIDEPRHEVLLPGGSWHLTPSEWGLLVALASVAGKVFSRRELVERLSGYTFDGYERAIDTHVKNLRHKLGPDAHSIVETVVGFGYRLGLDADG